MNKSVAVYPGSFDPITRGHIDIAQRALSLFGRLLIVVAVHPRKKTLFHAEERVEFIREAFRGEPRVEVLSHEGLIADLVERQSASIIIRGLRAVSDFEYEFQLALTNRSLNPKAETLFLMPDARYIFFSSSTIKEIARFKGDLSQYVTPVVAEALRKKLGTT